MKKTLTALVAVLALSACSTAPNEPTPDGWQPTQSDTYQEDRDALMLSWEMSTPAEQSMLCGSWEEMAHDALADVISDPQAIDDHFNSVCYGN